MILGNHDAASVITKQLAWPENVRILSHRKPETYRLEDLRVAIHGQSFPQRDVSENMVANYPAPVPDYFNIGMLHTALAGRPPHAPYAPCSVDELVARGYDYWALGHVHAYEIVHQNPYIVFPGNLQGRHIRETGSHGAVLVTVDDDIHVERMILDVLRWQIVEVDVTGAADLVGVATACGEALRAQLDATDNLPLAVRVRLTGATRLHGLLTDAGGRLREEVLAQAVALDEQRVWIEKVVTATTPATIADSAIADDTLAELRTAMEQAVNDAGFFEALRRDVDEILSKVPMPVLQEQGCGLSRFKGDSLITAVRAEIPGLIARLSQAAGA
jgi:DNA repair exonuclease SbcCD nuclease subunit